MRYRPSLPTIAMLWVGLCVVCWVGMFTASFRWAWDGCPSGYAFGPDRDCADPRHAVIIAVTLIAFLGGTGSLAWWYRRGRQADADDEAAGIEHR